MDENMNEKEKPQMTEKTFRDMLPLTDQQREFLGRKYSVQCGCKSCPLGHFEACNLAMGLPYKSECDEIRAEALRLDDEYRMESQMGKEILSQDEFSTITAVLINGDNSADYEKKGNEKICSSHAALHERVAELEKLKNNLSAQIDRRDADWNVERKRFNEKIADLEDKIAEKEIEQLQNPVLIDKKPKRADTKDEAEKKAFECFKSNPYSSLNHSPSDSMYFVTVFDANGRARTDLDDTEFPYAVPREPQFSIVQFGGPYKLINSVKLPPSLTARWDGAGSYSITITPSTGYRWDTETESIVPIED
jgi:hypothetical protein